MKSKRRRRSTKSTKPPTIRASHVLRVQRELAEADREQGKFHCRCGCGAKVRKGSQFKPGHDARLRPNSKWRKQHPELGV
jgi:hypothetical protein